MIRQTEQVERLRARLSEKYSDKAEDIVTQWSFINRLTVASKLIPEIHDLFVSAGHQPFIFVSDTAGIYGMPVVLAQRSVFVGSANYPELTGFGIGQALEWSDEAVVYLSSGIPIPLDVLKGPSVGSLPDLKSNKLPYWWPYSFSVSDLTNYDQLVELPWTHPVNIFEENGSPRPSFNIDTDPREDLGRQTEQISSYFATLHSRIINH